MEFFHDVLSNNPGDSVMVLMSTGHSGYMKKGVLVRKTEGERSSYGQ